MQFLEDYLLPTRLEILDPYNPQYMKTELYIKSSVGINLTVKYRKSILGNS